MTTRRVWIKRRDNIRQRYWKNYGAGEVLWSADNIGALKTRKGEVRLTVGGRRQEYVDKGWDVSKSIYPDEERLKQRIQYLKEDIQTEKGAAKKEYEKELRREEKKLRNLPHQIAAAKARAREEFKREKTQAAAHPEKFDMADLGEFLYQQERRQQPGMWNKEETDTLFDAAADVARRTSYGVRKEQLDQDSFIAVWSNASQSWGLNPNKKKKGEIVTLDANEIIIPTEHEMTATKVTYSLPELPLFSFSTEAKERGRDLFRRIYEKHGPQAAKEAEYKYWEARVRTGFAKPSDLIGVKKMLDKKYGGKL